MHEQVAFDRVDAERALGHDLAAWGRPLPTHCPSAIAEGFLVERARTVNPRRADRFVRKWLQLRMSALQRHRIVNNDVTPDFLRQIDVDRCPITRGALTHGELLDTDWSVDRLNNDGAYALNNLAVIGTGVNRAKGARTFQEVFLLSQRSHLSDGLAPVEWLRLSSIMLGPCFVSQPGLAPVIPLAAPLPSHSVRQAVQLVQYVFTRGARSSSGKNVLIKTFAQSASSERSVARLRLSAEAIHYGLKGQIEPYDAWLIPAVLQSFASWWETLDPDAIALAGELSRRMLNSIVLPKGRIDGWGLHSHGRFD